MTKALSRNDFEIVGRTYRIGQIESAVAKTPKWASSSSLESVSKLEFTLLEGMGVEDGTVLLGDGTHRISFQFKTSDYGKAAEAAMLLCRNTSKARLPF